MPAPAELPYIISTPLRIFLLIGVIDSSLFKDGSKCKAYLFIIIFIIYNGGIVDAALHSAYTTPSQSLLGKVYPNEQHY